MGKMLVFSSAVDGRDDEYNEWYNNVHLKEVCATDPFKSAERYRIPDVEGLPQTSSHRYVAIYEFDGPPQGRAQQPVRSLAGVQHERLAERRGGPDSDGGGFLSGPRGRVWCRPENR